MPIGTSGLDFLVNTVTASSQTVPSITALAGGRFVVMWQSGDGTDDASGSGIRGRIFNADGTAVGDDFLINSTEENGQTVPAVVGLADGGFVATWSSNDNLIDNSFSCIRAWVFNADGSPDTFVNGGNDFLVNTVTAFYQNYPSVAALAGGGFVITWGSEDQVEDNSGVGIRARIYNPDRTPIGDDFLLNTVTAGSQFFVSVASLSSGGFVATWESLDGTDDSSGNSIRGRVFNADGTPNASVNGGNDFLINTQTTGNQSVPSVTGLSDGRFLVTWSSADATEDNSGTGIRGRIFNADGTAGNDVLVNTVTTNNQRSPSVTALADGRFVVTWESIDGVDDNSSFGIRGRLFDLDGTAAGEDFLINTTTPGAQFLPSVTALDDGRFVVTWESNDGVDDTSNYGIRARIFDPTVFIGTAGVDSWSGGNFADRISGGGSSDFLSGLGGNDRIDGDAGTDVISGGAGDDYISGGADGDILYGGTGRDEIYGGDGEDTIYILPGDDAAGEIYNGGVGNGVNHLRVGPGAAPGALNYSVNLTDDTLHRIDRLHFEAPGTTGKSAIIRITADQLNGTGGAWYVGEVYGTAAPAVADRLVVVVGAATTFDMTFGGRFAVNFLDAKDRIEFIGDNDGETITGSDVADIMKGNGGNDTLVGRLGNDLFIGGAGRDTMSGGANSDIFRFTSRTHSPDNANRDQIIDFDKLGSGDRLDVSKLFGPKMAYIQKAAFTKLGQVRINDVSGNDLIVEANVVGSLAADFSVRLKNASFASMGADDFIL